jgi:hypothetical protein
MPLQIASTAVPPDVETSVQIEILSLAIKVLQTFVIGESSTSSERPALSVVPFSPRS